MKLSKKVRMFNEEIPLYISDLVMKAIEKYNVPKVVAVLGIAVKDYSSDDRLSPTHDIINILQSRGVKVKAFDPAVKKDYDFKINSMKEALEDVNVVLILAKQHGIEFDKIIEYATKSPIIVIDTRNIFSNEDAKKLGFILEKI